MGREHRSGFERGSFRDVYKALRECDIAIEVVDARNIEGTRLHRLDRTFKSKLVIAAAKCDLVLGCPKEMRTRDGQHVIFTSTRSAKGKELLFEEILRMGQGIRDRDALRRQKKREKRDTSGDIYSQQIGRQAAGMGGQRHVKTGGTGAFAATGMIKIMVFGIPNVGKSSIINMVASRKVARTGFKVGVTRGPQWVSLGKGMLLCDSPGVVPMHSSKGELALKAAYDVDRLEDTEEVAEGLIREFVLEKSDKLAKCYGIEMSDNPEEVLERIAIKRNFVKKGGVPDIERAIVTVLRDFQKGKFIF